MILKQICYFDFRSITEYITMVNQRLLYSIVASKYDCTLVC